MQPSERIKREDNLQNAHARGKKSTQLLPFADCRIPNNRPWEQCQNDVHEAGICCHEDVVVDHDEPWPASPRAVWVPEPLDRPALSKVNGGAGAQDEVDRDDDEPQEHLGAAGGDDS